MLDSFDSPTEDPINRDHPLDPLRVVMVFARPVTRFTITQNFDLSIAQSSLTILLHLYLSHDSSGSFATQDAQSSLGAIRMLTN